MKKQIVLRAKYIQLLYKTNFGEVHCGDCLEVMKNIPDESIDMILCDLPYGVTGCRWDSVLPFDLLWGQYERIIKKDRAIVLTAVQPFSSALVMSNAKLFRYEWIYNKIRGGNFQQANFAPMKCHEQILVFSKRPAIFNKGGSMVYSPQKTKGTKYVSTMGNMGNIVRNGSPLKKLETKQDGRYPISIQTFAKDKSVFHPTQKPVALFEYLIKTYTNDEDLVLDNCAGSGTTGVACINTKRKFVLIEKEYKYFEIIKKRIEMTNLQKNIL